MSEKINLHTTDVACQSFEPIAWSKKDTDLTIAAVKEHNAAWLAVCEAAP